MCYSLGDNLIRRLVDCVVVISCNDGDFQSCLGRSCERMCTKLYVLITELYTELPEL